MILSDKVDLANDAHVLGVEQGPDMFILTVEEKDSNGSGRIRLFFNKADTSLKEWIITDAQGLDTRIEVSNLDETRRSPRTCSSSRRSLTTAISNSAETAHPGSAAGAIRDRGNAGASSDPVSAWHRLAMQRARDDAL